MRRDENACSRRTGGEFGGHGSRGGQDEQEGDTSTGEQSSENEDDGEPTTGSPTPTEVRGRSIGQTTALLIGRSTRGFYELVPVKR